MKLRLHKIIACLLLPVYLCLVGLQCTQAQIKQSTQCFSCERIDFNFPERTCTGQKIEFNNVSVKCDGNISFLWSYGDGTPATYSNQHSYLSPGSYTVSLYIPATSTCKELLVEKKIPITDCPPSCLKCLDIQFAFPEKICRGEKVFFENTSTGCDKDVSFAWDFGDSTPVTADPYHIYKKTGNFKVRLFLQNNETCNRQDKIYSVTVVDCPQYNCTDTLPLICCLGCDRLNFTFPDTICAGKELTFINTSAGCSPGTPFIWDFGDHSSLSNNPSHLYTQPGTYAVKLITNLNSSISINKCFPDSIVKAINVIVCKPTTFCDGFNGHITATASNNNRTWVLTAAISGGVAPYQFNWIVNPLNIYTGQGTNAITLTIPFGSSAYPVKVEVRDKNNCLITLNFVFP